MKAYCSVCGKNTTQIDSKEKITLRGKCSIGKCGECGNSSMVLLKKEIFTLEDLGEKKLEDG